MIPFVVGVLLMQAVQATPPAPIAVPFAVGESFEYGAKFGTFGFNVGEATLKVVGIDTVRGVPSWHLSLIENASALIGLYNNQTRLESWAGTRDLVSRRFVHWVKERGKQIADDDFQIFGDSGYYRNRTEAATKPTPADPLDDLTFVYYLRTMELKVGETYTLPRYFRADHNPVTVTVVKHDSIDMPEGNRCYCLLLHPVVDEPNGLFSKKADAKLWLTDDGLRIPVQIQSSTGFGDVTLKLRKITSRQ